MKLSSPQAIEIYNLYPRRVKKPTALRAIMKAIDRDGFVQVKLRTQEYAQCVKGHDLQFVPYPATFFNQQMYLDDFEAMFPTAKTNGHSIMDLKSIITAKQAAAQKLKNQFSSEVAMGRSWSCEVARSEHRELRQQIEKLTQQLAQMA